MTFDEWEELKKISPNSPEAYYAEMAWNAALNEAIRIVESTRTVESTINNTITLITTELEFLKS